MGSSSATVVPKISQTTATDCTFLRLELPPGGHVEVTRVFHENMVIAGFTGATWLTRQSGRSRLEVPGSIVIREAGEVFDAKTLEVDAERGSLCREMHLPTGRLAALLEQTDGCVPPLNAAMSLIADRCVYDLFVETHRSHEQPGCALKQSSDLASLAHALAQATSGRRPIASGGSDRRRYIRTIEYMREHYQRPITLQELSDVSRANPFVLLRRFRQEFGLTPHEYLRIHRVNRAKEFIREGMKLADVAALCGFADQSHLNRQFKKTVGVTPGQFIETRALRR